MRLAITLDGLRNLIRDLRAAGQGPAAILVSEFEKKDLKFEMMSLAKATTPDAEATVDRAVCIIDGVIVMSNKSVPRGRAWLVPRDPLPRKRLDTDILNRSMRLH